MDDFDIDIETSVPELLIEHPRLLELFEELGIEYTCGGKSLRSACEQCGLDADAVVKLCQLRLGR